MGVAGDLAEHEELDVWQDDTTNVPAATTPRELELNDVSTTPRLRRSIDEGTRCTHSLPAIMRTLSSLTVLTDRDTALVDHDATAMAGEPTAEKIADRIAAFVPFERAVSETPVTFNPDYECSHDCGFIGAFDDVYDHEKTCSSSSIANIDGSGGLNSLAHLWHAKHMVAIADKIAAFVPFERDVSDTPVTFNPDYECSHDCGFIGVFDDVCDHERTCTSSIANIDGPGGVAALNSLAHLWHAVAGADAETTANQMAEEGWCGSDGVYRVRHHERPTNQINELYRRLRGVLGAGLSDGAGAEQLRLRDGQFDIATAISFVAGKALAAGSAVEAAFVRAKAISSEAVMELSTPSDSMGGLEQATEEAKAAAAQLWEAGKRDEAAEMDQMVCQLQAMRDQITAVEVVEEAAALNKAAEEEAALFHAAAVTIQHAYKSYILRDYNNLEKAATRKRNGETEMPEIDAWRCEHDCGFTSKHYVAVKDHEQTCTFQYVVPIIPAVEAGVVMLSAAESALAGVAADFGARVDSASELAHKYYYNGLLLTSS